MSAYLRRQLIKSYQIATGRRFLTRLEELNRLQWLSRDELLSLQQAKLRRLLEHAYAYVPYYRRLFDQVGFRPDDLRHDPASFRKVPTLSKAMIRENFADLQTTDPEVRSQLSVLTTGGSTGEPLKFMQDHTFRDYVMADLHRHLGWAGWELGVPHCYIWGTSFEIEVKQTLRARLMDWLLNRFVTNAYVLSEESMAAFSEAIRKRRPEILFGYPSSMYRFAEFVRQRNLEDIRFKSIVSCAEVLYPHQRQLMEDTFAGKVFDCYGTRELGGLACQCESRTGLHVSIENIYLEILNENGQLTHPGEPGNIIVTNLNNYGMPFIRYNLADVVSWYPSSACTCGRAHPMLRVVEGRHNDMFRTRDGRMVWGGVANPLWGAEGVKQFQFVQKTYDLVVVRIVKEGALPAAVQTGVVKAIQTALGQQVQVEFQFPEAIALEKSGKHRYQICEVDQGIRQSGHLKLEEELRRG
jgi:phenylacetate-CoA ligase